MSSPIPIPKEFRFAGVHCGLKRNPNKQDVALIVSDRPATAAGLYTKNLVVAAPVTFDRRRTPAAGMRLVVVNSGNANACTGERGDADTACMAEVAAKACGTGPEGALVLSTGVIGEFLPMTKIEAGIQAAAGQLADDEASLTAAARGMMTTDTVHKLAGRSLRLGDHEIRLAGLAKGAAMIGPNMATMLAVVISDAPIEPAAAQELLQAAVGDSFNCISIDGHMSTNDSVLLLANGAAGGPPLVGKDRAAFASALAEVCVELARAIVHDGEGATHLITIDVRGCADRESAFRIAKTVADSPLVKTAVAGADPNWGRIVSAAGYAGVAFDPLGVRLELNGAPLYELGTPLEFDRAGVSASIRDERETSIVLTFAEGDGCVRFWTTDLTAEYVRLNADYHT